MLSRFLVGNDGVLIYGFSYVYHAINLWAFTVRQSDVNRSMMQSLLFRMIAYGVLAYLMVPYLSTNLNPIALIPLALGIFLHTSAVLALGLQRTYYAVELGQLPESKVQKFPYGLLRHPMGVGMCLELIGLYFLSPHFTSDYPYLVLGHLVLTLMTLVVEHFDFHLEPRFYGATVGTLEDLATRQTVDELREWTFDHFRTNLRDRCSMHRYIKTLPPEVVSKIDQVRYAEEVMAPIRQAFPNSQITALPMTDEIYISRYNLDRGGDQGLFDKHHDGNLRFLPGCSVVRSLLYLSSEDKLEVVFETTGTKSNLKTYDFGILDFHKELHWVDGSYDPKKPPRVLLKCNYYVDHFGFAPYRWICLGLNIGVFYVVKAAMEYSKSPQTILQRIIGWLCNVVRRLNNINPAVPIVLVLFLFIFSARTVLRQFDGAFWSQ